MARLFAPAHPPLLVPGTSRRVLRRPDLRTLLSPRLSGAPLSAHEVDFDDLIIHRAWRTYSADRPGEVRYFMYELSQRNPGSDDYDHFFKAVRLVRLTRVPRYLRNSTSHAGPNLVFEQQRDVLAALREQQVLFLNVIAKSPQLPLVFAYGVQGVGETPEQAAASADRAYAVLTFQLDGTYQQLEYAPLTVEEGELLARYQAEWDHLAMARGRPLPVGETIGTAGILDGNRTAVESTNNQLESFIRAMNDKSFMLSLVTVPLSPAEITTAWRNISTHLSRVRSDQQGSRSVMAGVALPLSMGTALGTAAGDTHSTGTTAGVGSSTGVSHTLADGLSHSTANGVTDSVSQSHAAALSHSLAAAQNVSHSDAVAASQSHATSLGESVSHAASQSTGQSVSVGASHGISDTQSMSAGHSVSDGRALGVTDSAGSNWTNSVGKSTGASLTDTQGVSAGHTDSLSQTLSIGNTAGDGISGSGSASSSAGVHGGLLGVGGTHGTSTSTSQGENQSNSNNVGLSQTGGGSANSGWSDSHAAGLTQGVNVGESAGGSLGRSVTATNNVGTADTLTAGRSLGATDTQSMTQAASVGSGSSLTSGASLSQTAGTGLTQTAGVATGESQTAGVGTSSTDTAGVAAASSHTTGASTSQTATAGTSQGLSQQQALSDAYMVAMSRTSSTTGTLGAVPSLGVSLTKQTFDEAKRVLGDILEAQQRRYIDGIESGGFLYQMFLVCPDDHTLAGAAGLLKSAFWGPGGDTTRLPQPFHVIHEFDPEPARHEAEKRRLLTHAAAFTSYRKRERVVELVEPFEYSSYLTPGEAAAFCHPPTAESTGLLAVWDSAPVMAMPANRQSRDIYLGHIFNGERGKVMDVRFGVDLDELKHILIAGTTGSGKTTTMMRMLTEAATVSRTIVQPPTPENPVVVSRQVKAGILGLDWMHNMRRLASVVEPERFRFYSVSKPALGAFRFNLLAIPDEGMNPAEWMASLADNFTASFNLGEFGRSLIHEFLNDLYTANRLESYELRPAGYDAEGTLVRPAVVLEALDRASLPAEAVRVDADGFEYANVFTYPALSRLVDVSHLALLVLAKVEELATPEGGRLYGTAMRDRIQSLWRRMGYYAPGQPLAQMLRADSSLAERSTLGVRDLIDPDRGLVTVIETDGLDQANRRLILGTVLLAVYRFGMHHGEGVFDHDGHGPGTFVVLEEAHELLGERGEDEDAASASTRVALYESLFRRARALGLRLSVVVQNAGAIPAAITSNTSSVFVHRQYDKTDRDRVFNLLNFSNQIGQHLREYRYLGELPVGFCIVRLDAKTHFLQSAPVQILTDPAAVAPVSDAQLAALARGR